MRAATLISIKDLKIRIRDRSALVMGIVVPRPRAHIQLDLQRGFGQWDGDRPRSDQQRSRCTFPGLRAGRAGSGRPKRIHRGSLRSKACQAREHSWQRAP